MQVSHYWKVWTIILYVYAIYYIYILYTIYTTISHYICHILFSTFFPTSPLATVMHCDFLFCSGSQFDPKCNFLLSFGSHCCAVVASSESDTHPSLHCPHHSLKADQVIVFLVGMRMVLYMSYELQVEDKI